MTTSVAGDRFIRCPPISPHAELVENIHYVGDGPAEEDPIDLDPPAQLLLDVMLDRAELPLPPANGALHFGIAFQGPHWRLDRHHLALLLLDRL